MSEFLTKSKILVLFANPYDMVNENHEQVQGLSVHYLFWGENGAALATKFSDGNSPVGYQRAKVSLPYIFRSKVLTAPAIYEGSFEMTVGGDGKPVLKLVDLDYLCKVQFSEAAPDKK